MGLLTGDAFDELFVTFEHTARKFECRESYGVPDEDEPYQRFLASGDIDSDLAWFEEWAADMRTATGAGKTVQRVRVVDEPLSDYLRFETALGVHNAEAGEDIRYLARDDAERLALPTTDWWLFDARTLARLHFDDDGRPLGAEMIDDPKAVVEHAAAFDAARHYALPFDQYQQHHQV